MPEKPNNESENVPSSDKGIGFFQTIFSIFAAMFGVQSEEKHKRDFEEGSASNFIFAGIVLTIMFIVTLFMVVSSVLEKAGVK